ncbi:class IV adenylate cyclase [Shewanella sp. D64]|uniref:class IV adenylate cyclase n=1 Tax=unclassified Shewanella TaxID=196818 RepID=UPI0022BA45AC|nr:MULTISPECIES: class IV adenylate cyclase [unclassified Shewanella]MEC4726592.1 class IV adenylate cyclase [Shewanella sp. D64]MEC4737367.1 class IV adenylate cyclase [Shewanella sp. E94]WBJ97189.1 class IV adenylate cyclase [Shewanella sp. MTB7]
MSVEHFKGKYEVELKYRLNSKTDFLRTLNTLSYEIMFEDNTDSDWYFDTPEQTLLSEKKSLCIREVEPFGIKLWIVKGPELDRCEATNITNSDAAKSMLMNMGYQVSLVMKKTRSIYFIGQFHITLDYLEGIGDFAEFAIMTNDESQLEAYRYELEGLARKFSLNTADLEHKSYRTLFTENQ